MAFLSFDKAELVNLEYSLARESLRSNRAGSYASTTISGCNTRKYHGLLVCPIEAMDGENHVLLSSLDVTVLQHERDFNLGIHKYEGDHYIPRGHKYIRDYNAEIGSKMTYRVGGVVLSREMMLVQKKEQILIRFTLEEAHSPTRLQFRPFLAFRNIHMLSKANLYVNRHFDEVPNGITLKLYDGYPNLYMQFSKKNEFVPVPDWYYNIEYMEEQRRGYDFKEDLYVPGYFEMSMKTGESVIFSASTARETPAGLKKKFDAEKDLRIPRDSFRNCLDNASEQFLLRKGKQTEILAGFPWHGIRGRDTFIALPGLTFSKGDFSAAHEVIATMIGKMKDGLFPNTIHRGHAVYNSSDAPLWFIRALQLFEEADPSLNVWKTYGRTIKQILSAYRSGTHYDIRMLENGLITGGEKDIPVTWMDATVNGRPVTARTGLAVEVNALWYNAVCQAIEWAVADKKFISEWKAYPEMIRASYINTFWSEEYHYLADYVQDDEKDFSVRPNQVIATALNYSPLSQEMKKEVLDVVESELLTPRGLRTLSPKNERYEGIYEGNQEARDAAYHQGTAWPWLLEHFVKGYLDVHKRSGLTLIKRLYREFEDEMTLHGIGSISELYDGNPPHYPKGATSFATSVAALIRIGEMIDRFNN
jgi:predicted glycogen debranching enzyme